jgi:hypothetical protein
MARVTAVTRILIDCGSKNASPFRQMRRTAMNRLSLISICGSLAALAAAVPAHAKSPAPLPIEARVANHDDDAEQLQLRALWNTKRACPADAAIDVMPPRFWDGCTNPAALRESTDAFATGPETDK